MIKLYLVNFLTAVSTVIGMTIIPIITTQTLGVSLLILGVIEGFSELLSNFLKLYSGVIFDKIRNKKILFIASTFIGLLAKITLLFGSIGWIVQSKFLERIANGLFATPRDSYVSLNSSNIGKSLSAMVSFKTAGCITGGFIVSLISYKYGFSDNIPSVLKLTCLFGLIALILSFFIKDTKVAEVKNKTNDKVKFRDCLKELKPHIVILPVLFFAARFNDGLIIIFLKDMGFGEWFYTSTISIFNISMLIVSPVIGYLIYKKKTNLLVVLTILSLLLFNITFFLLPSNNVPIAILGLMFWGVQRASAAILFISIIVKNVPKNLYGNIIGLNSVTTGISVLICSSIVGFLAEYSYQYVFVFSGFISLIAFSYFVYITKVKGLEL